MIKALEVYTSNPLFIRSLLINGGINGEWNALEFFPNGKRSLCFKRASTNLSDGVNRLIVSANMLNGYVSFSAMYMATPGQSFEKEDILLLFLNYLEDNYSSLYDNIKVVE